FRCVERGARNADPQDGGNLVGALSTHARKRPGVYHRGGIRPMVYDLFSLFLVRLAGAPFEPLEGLGTPETVRIGRTALALENGLHEEGAKLLERARASGGEVRDRVARRVQAVRWLIGAGLGLAGWV